MAGSASWLLRPSLAEIKAIMSEVGAKNTILAIYFRQPYVLDEASGMRGAGAILAHFGVSDTALLDIVSGKVSPQGRMPFALARNLDAIKEKKSDEAGYPEKDTLYRFGFGLNY
jgi:beta-glucosidase